MLVLTRKADESIVIDGRITIRVLQLRGNRIRLGIEAPSDMPVRRAELAPKPAAESPGKSPGKSSDESARQETCQEPAPQVPLSEAALVALAELMPGPASGGGTDRTVRAAIR